MSHKFEDFKVGDFVYIESFKTTIKEDKVTLYNPKFYIEKYGSVESTNLLSRYKDHLGISVKIGKHNNRVYVHYKDLKIVESLPIPIKQVKFDENQLDV